LTQCSPHKVFADRATLAAEAGTTSPRNCSAMLASSDSGNELDSSDLPVSEAAEATSLPADHLCRYVPASIVRLTDKFVRVVKPS
jgi:hypothetical protein